MLKGGIFFNREVIFYLKKKNATQSPYQLKIWEQLIHPISSLLSTSICILEFFHKV